MPEGDGPNDPLAGADRTGLGIEATGIESVVLSAGEHKKLDESLDVIKIAYALRAREGIITEAQYDAAMAYLELLLEANDRTTSIEDGVVIFDEDREPALALYNRPVHRGSGQQLYFMAALSDHARLLSPEQIEQLVNKRRLDQERAIAVTETLVPPRDIDPVTFPLGRVDPETDITSDAELISEALSALDNKVIDQAQFRSISTALLFRQILEREVCGIHTVMGNDGQFWRAYSFPSTLEESSDE